MFLTLFRVGIANAVALGLVQSYYIHVYPAFKTANPYIDATGLVLIGGITLGCMAIVNVTAPSGQIPLTNVPFDGAFTKFIGFFLAFDLFIVAVDRALAPGTVLPDVVLTAISAVALVFFLPKGFRRLGGIGGATYGIYEVVIGVAVIVVLFRLFVWQYHDLFHLLNPTKDEVPLGDPFQITLATKLAFALFTALVTALIADVVTGFAVRSAFDVSYEFHPIRILLTCTVAGVLALFVTYLIPYTDSTDLFWRTVYVFIAMVEPAFDAISHGIKRTAGLVDSGG